MSDQEVNKAIAKAIGWTGIKPSGRLDGQMVGYPAKNPIIGKPQEIPDFANDLNLCHQFEKTLDPHWLPSERQQIDDSEWEMYVCELSKIADRGPTHSTARQRSEAFLKVKIL